jgi:hemophore-related protein
MEAAASDEGEAAMMLPSGRRTEHRAVVGAVGAVALAFTMFLGSAAAASAQPPPPPAPPNCSPADWAGVRAGVAAALSAYLFTHPPVNDFFATLKGQPREEVRPQVQEYLDANPQIRAEIEGIRQPAVDFLARCGVEGRPLLGE